MGCVDYRGGGAPRVNPLLVGRVRQDRRCGAQFPLTDGLPSECNGTGENPCCSKWGYCGPGADHCECEGCADYRTADQKGQSEPANASSETPVRSQNILFLTLFPQPSISWEK